jgi:WD40-like Beta Propeller Repeat
MMILALMLVAACGVKLTEAVAQDDAGVDAASMVDAAPDAPADAPAPPLGAFGLPSKVVGLATDGAAEDDITLNRGETELLFTINPGGGNKNLYTSRRANTMVAWGPVTAVTAINTNGDDATPRLSSDELTLYFSTNRNGTTSEDIWRTQRENVDAAWGPPDVMPIVNAGDAIDRWYNPCGGRYVIVSNRTNAGDTDLYEGIEGQPPVRLALSVTGANDTSPFLTADCLTMYWARENAGKADLYLATRASLSEPWQALGIASDLSTPASSEFDPWMSADRRRMYFASDADGEFDIYLATR